MPSFRQQLTVIGFGLSLLLLLHRPTPVPAQTTQPTDLESRWFRNVRQLTHAEQGLARAGEAYFSADGRRICFQAYPTGEQHYQIYVMNLDGTGLKMVSTGVGATTCAYFHPDGQKLIFAANHHDQRPATQGEPRHTGRERPAGEPGGSRPGPPGAASETAPATQPADRGESGKATGPPPRLAGPSGRHDYAWQYFPGMDIFEYTFATNQLRRLSDADGYDAECAYSPDGKLIVFSSLRDGVQEIYVCDADGANPRRVTRSTGKNGGPFFSPDGRRIVYRSDRVGRGHLQVFVNNLEGTDERAITPPQERSWCPFWHPSGKWIIYTRMGDNFDLYLIRDDGSQCYRVTADAAFDGLPVFSPDGRHLMWTSMRGGLEAPQVFLAEFLGLTAGGELVVTPPPANEARGAPGSHP